MRRHDALLIVGMALGLADAAPAVDVAAGQAKAAQVCAACHGANGISVAPHIPHLAGQRTAYLEKQLRAWKDGSRQDEIMNAIAAQLGSDEIANLAAYFGALPGPAVGASSDFLPNLAATRVRFPDGFEASYTRYRFTNAEAAKRVTFNLANPVALAAARDGRPLPDGAVLVVATYAAKLGADGQPLRAGDGSFVPDKALGYTVMAREAGWGDAIPEMLRNENWNYALFSADRQLRPGVNQAECLGCHKPLRSASYVFTMERLTAVATAR